MGVRFQDDKGRLEASAMELHGADVALEFPSVGATENLILAAMNLEFEIPGVRVVTTCQECVFFDLKCDEKRMVRNRCRLRGDVVYPDDFCSKAVKKNE